MIDVDKIFLSKSNEGSSAVLNALRLCMYWKTVNEHVMGKNYLCYLVDQSFSSLMENFSQYFKFYLHTYIIDVHRRVLKIKLYEGNMFGSIMAFIRRCKDLYEICQANGQLFRFFSWHHFHEKISWKWFVLVLLFVYILTMYKV